MPGHAGGDRRARDEAVLAVDRDLLAGDFDDDLERADGRRSRMRGVVLVARRVRPLAMRFGRTREFRIRIAMVRLIEEEKETLGCHRRRRPQPERHSSGQRRPAGP